MSAYFKQFPARPLKVNYTGAALRITHTGAAAQEIFVLCCLNGKKEGTFLDLGCGRPDHSSNTFLLEKHYNWRGVAVDLDKTSLNEPGWQDRTRSTILLQDATLLNYKDVILKLNTSHIDYLSLDLDPPEVTLKGLKNIPFNEVEFSVITFEHDRYRTGETIKAAAYETFTSNGYIRVVDNIGNFEDWYVNPKYVDLVTVKPLLRTFTNTSSEWYSDILDLFLEA